MTATSKGYPKTPIPQNIEALAAEVERDPTDLVAKISLANALEQAGEVSKAVALYHEVVALEQEGIYGSVSQKALEALQTSEHKSSELTLLQHEEKPQSTSPSQGRHKAPDRHKALPLLQQLRQGWENLNLRTKLTILLVGSAALPVIVATQGIVAVTKESLFLKFEESLQREGTSFTQDYVLGNVEESKSEANTIAQFIQTTQIDLNNPRQIANQRELLQTFIGNFKVSEDSGSVEKNIRIVTDAQGKIVAQNIQTLAEAYYNYPPDKIEINPRYRPVSLPLGIALGDIAIVKNALRTGKVLSGMELLKSNVLKRLGQEKQAYIGLRPQPTQGFPEPDQPFPKGTYDIDGGKVALAAMVVHPIKVGNKLVGTVIVGAIMNRTPVIVDSFKERLNVPFATIFAQDWRVSSNVPYTNGQTRAIGTRAARKVAETVLNQGQEFIGQTKIVGGDYLGVYQPLYDHQKELNPVGAKPVGMAFVGWPIAESENLLAKQQLIAYSIGGGMLLLAGLIAIPVANSLSRPLRRLSNFAQQVEDGKQGVRLEPIERQDEIGVLSRQLSAMIASIEANLEAVRHQEALRYQEAERQRRAKERLQQGAIDLLLDIEGANQGDLTVRAKVKEGEMGSIADAFNTVISSLRQIVIQVQNAADLVHESAFESEASVQQLSDKAKTQAKVMARVLGSVEEMARSTQSVASSSQEAATIARQALVAAQDGDKTMDQTVVSIETIRASVADTTKKAKRLAESSQEISKIVSIISGISEKTNLLAFNASIEAARAGENGQGFRVVADEVRRLAERVTDSTKEIEQLVSTIQQETSDVLQTMEGSTTQVAHGTQLVAKTKQTLQGLAHLSQEIDQFLQSISASTVFQTRTSKKVNKTMQVIAATQETTASESETVLSTMHEQVKVAEELQNSVSRFRVEK
jgi:methyl-accepting chemotaxis protein